MSKPLYRVDNLVIDLHAPAVSVRAVDGVSFSVRAGETLAIVGESGSGKTVMTLGPLGLLPEGVRIDIRGEAEAGGVSLIDASAAELSALRGRYFGVVFQDPISSLNPMLKIGPQLASQISRFRGLGKAPARREAVQLLRRTGIPDPEDRFGRYPHEMSGGMLQRSMIALALAPHPSILIADEPTTALDATVQAQVLELLRQIQSENEIAVVLITHDVGAVAAAADRVLVLYAGQIAEEGSVVDVLTRPAHPYTRGLLASVPDFRARGRRAEVHEIPGAPPNQLRLEPGCRFADRCAHVVPDCRIHRPPLIDVAGSAPGHRAACPVIVAREGLGVVA